MTGRKRDKQKSKQKLLKAAFDIFVAKGFDGARVDEIAGKAGVNKRMIYDWFGSKEQLYTHVLRTTFEDLFTYPLPEPDLSGNPLHDAKAIVRWYFDFLSENPGFVRLLEWETLSGGHRAGQVLLDVMGGALKRLQEVIHVGKQRGVFRQDITVPKVVTLLHDLCFGFFSRIKLLEILWKQDLSTRERQEEMLEHILAVVFDGMVAPGRGERQEITRRTSRMNEAYSPKLIT